MWKNKQKKTYVTQLFIVLAIKLVPFLQKTWKSMEADRDIYGRKDFYCMLYAINTVKVKYARGSFLPGV